MPTPDVPPDATPPESGEGPTTPPPAAFGHHLATTGSPLERLPLSEVLRRLAYDATRQRIAIGDLLIALGDRALGALLFFFAFPNVLPMPPGTSAFLGAPLVFLAAQLMLGMQPWLPRFITTRSIARDDFRNLIERITPWLERAEKLLRPRLSGWVLPPTEYVIGALCLILAIIIMLPIPLGNMLPALAISLIALGIIERDGLWVLGGIVTSVVGLVVVSGVIFAIVKTAAYLLARVFA